MVKRGLLFLIVALAPVRVVFGADVAASTSEAEAAASIERAPVILDGNTLFVVRGTSNFPAERRAAGISERLRAAARDSSTDLSALQAVASADFTALNLGDHLLMRVFDADAAMDGIPRAYQAEIYRQNIAAALASYRHDRLPRVLLHSVAIAVALIVAMILVFAGVRRLFRWLESLVERHFKTRLESLQHQSHQFIQAGPLWQALRGILRSAQGVLIATAGFVWLDRMLRCFPWTRPIAQHLFPLFLNPIIQMGLAFVDAIPNLVFLGMLILVTRYLLKFVRLYFSGLDRGTITWAKFDQDWAWPTYKIVRVAIVAFAAVIAYPYIPGSNSEAFKGVSLFMGVVFSLGSSSVISNLLAGYSLTYRRVFKIGDRVKIGQTIGSVVESGLVVTRIRTPKNEDVVVPNSMILNNDVMNYSTMAQKGELILHATVGIGYETSWRQVEAMLLRAADRTPGVQKQPAPFVHLLRLGDFAVEYEINVGCNDASKVLPLYTALHKNILDEFNEYGVQIMTPAYEGDPDKPKVVPKNKWFQAPARNGKSKAGVD